MYSILPHVLGGHFAPRIEGLPTHGDCLGTAAAHAAPKAAAVAQQVVHKMEAPTQADC